MHPSAPSEPSEHPAWLAWPAAVVTGGVEGANGAGGLGGGGWGERRHFSERVTFSEGPGHHVPDSQDCHPKNTSIISLVLKTGDARLLLSSKRESIKLK